jgi:hypothetical protein
MERRTAIEAVAAIACARTVARLDHKVRNNSAARVGILSTMATRGPTYGKSLRHNNLRVASERRVI